MPISSHTHTHTHTHTHIMKITIKDQNFIEWFCVSNIFWTIETFVAKLSMVMHHHEPDCLAKGLFCYHQGQGHNEGSYNQNTFFSISSELLILLQPNLVWWYFMSWNVLWKDCIAVYQSQGLSDGSKLCWLFISSVFSVLLISVWLN